MQIVNDRLFYSTNLYQNIVFFIARINLAYLSRIVIGLMEND